MRPFVAANQALGIRSANLMKSKGGLIGLVLQKAPGWMTEFLINRSTRRIHRAANAIALKDYS